MSNEQTNPGPSSTNTQSSPPLSCHRSTAIFLFMVIATILCQSLSVGTASTRRPFWSNSFSRPLMRKHLPFCLRAGSQSICSHNSTSSNSNIASTKECYRVYLAVGSNMGDRFENIRRALQLLTTHHGRSNNSTTRLLRTSFLHQTAPMYVKDQPVFWNGAVVLETDLEPLDLLRRIKDVEGQVGRDLEHGIRNGPRPVDLDILFYQQLKTDGSNDLDDQWAHVVLSDDDKDGPELIVPHPRMQERDFVLLPLLEIAGREFFHPVLNMTLGAIVDAYEESLTLAKDDSDSSEPTAVRILPLPRKRALLFNKTIIMGILNITPDSFSDGGTWYSSIDKSVERALEMQRHGADIIDIGGESTRPGAKEINVVEEIRRTVPVISAVRAVSDVPISIDTRRADVARAAVHAGADIVNDVSAGTFDPEMLSTVAELGVPMVLMHMRGTPETMQSMIDYEDVVEDVAESLRRQSVVAEEIGIHRWMQIVDPGIGFAKDLQGNLRLLRHLSVIRKHLDNLPVLLGTSRKGFIGKLSGGTDPVNRDPGTIASCVAALCLEGPQTQSSCNIVRVHNVEAFAQAAVVMDAIRCAKRSKKEVSIPGVTRFIHTSAHEP